MKITLSLSILFCTIALPVFGELTETDLNKIRLIIQEEIEKELKPIKADIVTLQTDVAWMRGKFETRDTQFESVDKEIPQAKYVYYGLIALIVAVIAAPLIPFVQEIRRDRALERQVEKLTQEIETLKQQRIVNP